MREASGGSQHLRMRDREAGQGGVQRGSMHAVSGAAQHLRMREREGKTGWGSMAHAMVCGKGGDSSNERERGRGDKASMRVQGRHDLGPPPPSSPLKSGTWRRTGTPHLSP